MNDQAQNPPKASPLIYRPRDLASALGVTPMTLRRWQEKDLLPARKRIGPNVSGWLASEIEEWLDSRPQESCLNSERIEKLKLGKERAEEQDRAALEGAG